MNTQILTLSELEIFDSKSPRSGSQRRFLCPECGVNKPKDSAHRSLAVNTSNGAYICHRCQIKGKLKEFWEERPKFTKKQRTGIKLMSHFAIDNVPPVVENKAENISDTKTETLSEKMQIYQQGFLHSPAEMYLDSRSICTNTAHTAQSGYAARWEHWEKILGNWNLKGTDRRVVFPVVDEESNLVAVHARAVDKNFINSSKITRGDKSKGVFLTNENVFASNIIAISEAPIDALALRMCGIPGIALIGTSSPDWIFEKLSFKSIIIATDADQAGDKIAHQLKDRLTNQCAKVMRLRPRQLKDWAEVLEKIGFNKLNEHLKPFAEASTDEERFLSSMELIESNRIESANFAGNLLKSGNLKFEFLQKLSQKICV